MGQGARGTLEPWPAAVFRARLLLGTRLYEAEIPSTVNQNVYEFAGSLGRGSVTAVESLGKGRNDTYLATVSGAERVFIKRITGNRADVRSRLQRIESFHCHIREGPAPVLTPEYVGSDWGSATVAYNWLSDTTGLDEAESAGTLNETMTAECGALLAALHEWTPSEASWIDRSLPSQPPVHRLERLPLAVYIDSSAGEEEAFRLVQLDTEILGRLRELRIRERSVLQTSTHCDIRLDQFLQTDSGIFVIDWEEFRIADPARDVGAFIGDILYRVSLRAFNSESTSGNSRSEYSRGRNSMIRDVAKEVDSIYPLLSAFWQSYSQHRSYIESDLRGRSVSYAGWHLYDRMFAVARNRTHLPAAVRATAGIGRATLMDPENYIPVLGLKEGPVGQ